MKKLEQEAFAKRFEHDVEHHVVEVFQLDGARRHLRFRRPGTMCMHFDIITWHEQLCYTGDMGTFVFRRLHDMLEFFRRDKGRPLYEIDYSYWAEKIVAQDRSGVQQFSIDLFRKEVRDYLDQHADGEELSPDLLAAVDEEVLCAEDEVDAWARLREFHHTDATGRAFYFQDWERSCKEYTHGFLWCCHALRWGIEKFDLFQPLAPPAPDGYALVMDTGHFVGAWKSRAIAEKLQNRSSMSKGEVVRAFAFVDEPGAQGESNA